MHCLETIGQKNKGTPHPYEDLYSHLFWIICSCNKSLWKKSTWICYKIHVSLWKCIVYNFIHSFIIKDFVRKYLPLKWWQDCPSKDLYRCRTAWPQHLQSVPVCARSCLLTPGPQRTTPWASVWLLLVFLRHHASYRQHFHWLPHFKYSVTFSIVDILDLVSKTI